MSLLSLFKPQIAYAHCDIPCGIYDPHAAQVGAHTVIRMIELMSEHDSMHDVARIVHVKEEHARTIEEELGTLENDYFKEEHFKDNPELKDLLAAATKLSAKVRQVPDMEVARELLEKVLVICEIFYKTKGVEPVRVKSIYPTAGEIVTYK